MLRQGSVMEVGGWRLHEASRQSPTRSKQGTRYARVPQEIVPSQADGWAPVTVTSAVGSRQAPGIAEDDGDHLARGIAVHAHHGVFVPGRPRGHRRRPCRSRR